MPKKVQNVHDDSRCKGIQGNTSEAEIKCVCLNARSIINKKKRIKHYYIKAHIILVSLNHGQAMGGRKPDSQSCEPGFESPFATVSKIGHFRSLH